MAPPSASASAPALPDQGGKTRGPFFNFNWNLHEKWNHEAMEHINEAEIDELVDPEDGGWSKIGSLKNHEYGEENCNADCEHNPAVEEHVVLLQGDEVPPVLAYGNHGALGAEAPHVGISQVACVPDENSRHKHQEKAEADVLDADLRGLDGLEQAHHAGGRLGQAAPQVVEDRKDDDADDEDAGEEGPVEVVEEPKVWPPLDDKAAVGEPDEDDPKHEVVQEG